MDLEFPELLQVIVYYDQLDCSFLSREFDHNLLLRWVWCVLRVRRNLMRQMKVWILNAFWGGLLWRALLDLSSWGYMWCFDHFSTWEARNIFQKEPIRHDLLVASPFIDASLRVDRRWIQNSQESANSAAIRDNISVGTRWPLIAFLVLCLRIFYPRPNLQVRKAISRSMAKSGMTLNLSRSLGEIEVILQAGDRRTPVGSSWAYVYLCLSGHPRRFLMIICMTRNCARYIKPAYNFYMPMR